MHRNDWEKNNTAMIMQCSIDSQTGRQKAWQIDREIKREIDRMRILNYCSIYIGFSRKLTIRQKLCSVSSCDLVFQSFQACRQNSSDRQDLQIWSWRERIESASGNLFLFNTEKSASRWNACIITIWAHSDLSDVARCFRGSKAPVCNI